MKLFNQIFRLSGLLAAVYLAGCTTTPFAPLAVPHNTAIRTVPVVPKDNTKELEKLNRTTAPAYKINPGDIFSVTVPGREDLNRPNITVMSDGAISVFPIGYVRLSGLTLEEASGLLSKKYSKFVRNCEVFLEPVKIRQSTVTVVGAVASPGIKDVTAGVTRLTDVLASCGGLKSSTTEDSEPMILADLHGAYILRKGRILPVNFQKLVNEGNWLHNIPVVDQDYIFVPSLENTRITVLGEVCRKSGLSAAADALAGNRQIRRLERDQLQTHQGHPRRLEFPDRLQYQHQRYAARPQHGLHARTPGYHLCAA